MFLLILLQDSFHFWDELIFQSSIKIHGSTGIKDIKQE